MLQNVKFHKLVEEEKISEYLSTSYDQVTKSWFGFQNQWMRKAYHTFYDLEYELNLNNQDRHELATVVIDRGTLYTFAVGTNQERWNKVNKLFENVIESFNFLI